MAVWGNAEPPISFGWSDRRDQDEVLRRREEGDDTSNQERSRRVKWKSEKISQEDRFREVRASDGSE